MGNIEKANKFKLNRYDQSRWAKKEMLIAFKWLYFNDWIVIFYFNIYYLKYLLNCIIKKHDLI